MHALRQHPFHAHALPEAEEARHDPGALAAWNRRLQPLDAEARIELALQQLPGPHLLSSSFGAQSAVCLHLLARKRRVPVILIDTGYLFAETYRFIDELVERLDLDLRIYRPEISPAWQEARHGRLWEQGLGGIERYNRLHKVEPMQRALRETGAATWASGLRRDQSRSRARLPLLGIQDGRFKLHPIADWNDRQVGRYLKAHDLPYHPLWEQGYISIGDTHTTRPLGAGMDPEHTRFHGLKRECGLHEGVVGG